MFLRNRLCRSYQRGGWRPGAKHQKHMSMNPTLYLYRFPGPHGPGPYTMKYWWTLGCFPTGRETPFRLQEFLSTYQQEHVPLEVEEWLSCFVKDPLVELVSASQELLDVIESYPQVEATRGYKALAPSVAPLLKPLRKFEEQLSLKLSPVGCRAVLSTPSLKDRFLDDLYEYQEIIKECGSTPHRRLARMQFEESEGFDEINILPHSGNQKDIVTEKLGTFVGTVVSPPETTAPDERKLIHLLTTISEGCIKCHHYDDAFSVLGSSLNFCHDMEAQAVVYANLAISSLLNGNFKQAEFNGREAAMLQPKTKTASPAGARGYAAWAAAVAYQDDFEKAESIINDAISIYDDSIHLKKMKEQLRDMRLSTKESLPQSLRGSRSPLPSQQSRALLNGSGKCFDNEFDWAVFKNKLYPSKMNPTTNEMGSVFRRVGDLGGFISTSRSMERL